MIRRLLPIILVVVVGVGVGVWLLLRGGDNGSETTTTAPTETVPKMPVKTYFYLGNALVPVVVYVPKTKAVATAAARALAAGPPAGYSTTLPAGTRFEGLTISGGTVHADYSRALADAPRTAQGQIVYTLAQFPGVKGVLIDAGGSAVPLSNGAEKPISGPATTDDYVDLTPTAPIFVGSPIRDSTVTSPVKVSGTASVFEANIIVETWTAGKLVKSDSIMASRGAPERGIFDELFELPPGKHQLVFYEPSAVDGAHLHTTTVNLTVSP